MNSTISQLYDSFKIVLQRIKNNELPINVVDASFLSDFFSFWDEANTLNYSTQQAYADSSYELKSIILELFKKGDIPVVIGMMDTMLSLLPTIDDALLDNRANELFRYSEISKQIHYANKLRNNAIRGNEPKLEKHHFTGKGVVYTAIIGGYDNIPVPTFINPELDYILFTDNKSVTSDVWKVIYVDKPADIDSSRYSRLFKLLGHKYLSEYDYSIWIDGKIIIKGDPLEYINMYRDYSPILFVPHYEQCCAYDEAEACISLGKGNPFEIEKQINRYRLEGFPDHYGLIDGCVIVRELHDDKLNTTMETWWNELLNESGRDQISFGYSFWKNNMLYDTSNISLADNPFFLLTAHKSN